MKRLLYILLVIVWTLGCTNKTVQKMSRVKTLKGDDKVLMEAFIYNVYKSGGTRIDVENDNFDFTILMKNRKFRREYDLNELNIPAKTPGLSWINDDYACIATWWSQAQSRDVFIPMKQTNELVYLDRDIEETDSINNNIVYIDSIYNSVGKVAFRVENLLTRKSKTLDISINEPNEFYPFYDTIVLTKNIFTIITAIEKKSIDITEISNDF